MSEISIQDAIKKITGHVQKKILILNKKIDKEYEDGTFEIYIAPLYDTKEKYEELILALNKLDKADG